MFQSIEIHHKSIFEKYLKAADKQCCDYAFANLYAWAKFYKTVWCEESGFLVIRFHIAGSEKWAYLEPLGNGNRQEVLAFIFQDAAQENQPVRFFSLSESFVQAIQDFPESRALYFYKDRSFGNYLHGREKLAFLRGRKLHSKRNHITQFDKQHPNATWHIIDAAKDRESLYALLNRWIESQEKITTTILQEKEMIRLSIEHYDALQLFGVILKENDNPIAFSYGSQINGNTFCVHAEKADARYEGAYAKINQLTAQNLPEEIQYINREEDMGLPSLRKSKLSYYPDKISEEFFAFSKDSEEAKIWRLWQTAFPEDSNEFLATFIYPYSNPSSRKTLYEGNSLASMLHLLEFQSSWGKVGYIYGLATNMEFQKRGFAKKLILSALESARNNGCLAVWTIQDNKDFKAWQTDFGFSENQPTPLTFMTEDGFDFGSEDANFGICRILDVPAYLQKFAEQHREFSGRICPKDEIFPENQGIFEIKNATVTRISDIPAENGCHSSDLLKKFPLSHENILRFPVVSRQH